MSPSLQKILKDVRACRVCEARLPFDPRPVLRAESSAKILVVGQAPGTRVHESGIPWNDPSGVRLREWMGVSDTVFYDASRIAIIPMGFCYPGKGTSGDLPPRPECGPLWHPSLLEALPRIDLILLIGQYAQTYYLGKNRKKSLSATVQAWQEYSPRYLPTPHPSPRNKLWLKRNPWFEKDVVPELKRRVHQSLG